jgi:DNA-binding CsgD family transcriptional regulator
MVATENRRNDAREHLRRAHDIFSRVRSDGFAARARGELLALGDAVPKPDAGRSETLTSQESFIARLARDGHTNQEIGTRLFISTRTVEWHMSKILNKLDIKSRRGLRAALADSALSCTTLRFEVIWFMASVVKPQSTASVFAIMPSAPRSMQLANSSAPRNAVRRGSSASG